MSGRSAPLKFGVSTHGGLLAAGERQAITELIGAPAAFVLSFEDFSLPPPVAGLTAVAGCAATPVVTWEPWHAPRDGAASSAVPLADIAGGRHDRYLQNWADALAACPFEVYLRFAHECNGTWYPWTPAGGVSPDVYGQAWRHVHDVLADSGASNVTWVWAPNVLASDCDSPAPWYPGDEYVDVLGVDGYNWGTTLPRARWTAPDELFDATLAELRALGPGKPILVTEIGCAEVGGSKPAWITDAVSYLDGQPDVMGFIWFHHDKETDWRLCSSAESAAAMAGALRILTRAEAVA